MSRLFAGALAAPALALVAVASLVPGLAFAARVGLATMAVASVAIAQWHLTQHVVRPLGTLANLLEALRRGERNLRGRAPHASPAEQAFRELNALAEELQLRRLADEESAALLRSVLDGLDMAVLALDPEGRVRLANPAAEALWSAQPGELLGRSGKSLGLEAVSEEGEVAAGDFGPWEVRRLPFRQDGRPHELVVVSNVAEALRAEERAVFQRLVRVLTHEVHNSLTPIMTVAQAHKRVLERGPLPEELRADMVEGLAVIARRAEGLRAFLSRYAEISRLPPPDLAPFPVAPWIERVARLETRLTVAVDGVGVPILVGDQAQLEQLLVNLVRNAADAALEGGGHVTVRWFVQGRELTVLVEDDGPGLAGASSLFVPFFTTKPGGSGIGLVLARSIAEAHGGSLVLEDLVPPARGCRARLVLPLVAAARPVHRGLLRAPPGTRPAPAA